MTAEEMTKKKQTKKKTTQFIAHISPYIVLLLVK